MSHIISAQHHARRSVAKRRPAGPKGYPLLGVIPMIRKDPVSFFAKMSEQFGDIAYCNFGGHDIYFINHPDPIKHVLADNHHNYHKSRFYENLRPVFGDGLPMQEGESWLRRRKLAAPAFSHASLEHFAPIMLEQITEMLDAWEGHVKNDVPLNVAQEMFTVALKIDTTTLLSSNIKSQFPVIMDSITTMFRILESRIYSFFPLPYSFPSPKNVKFKRALRTMDDVILSCIEDHRKGNYNDLLAMFINAREELTNRTMDDGQVLGEARTALIAGHETTASALAWTFYTLAKHPEVELKVREEIDRVLQGRTPTFADLKNLSYTKWTMLETLRLIPSGWLFSRSPQEDDTLLGYDIPRGSSVSICPYTLHRRAIFWPEPEVFDPERFSPEGARTRSPYSYLGFGAGPRSCIGSGFSQVEGVLLLAATLQRYVLELIPGQDVKPIPMLFLRPNKPIWMKLRPAS